MKKHYKVSEHHNSDEYRYLTTETVGNYNFIIIGKPENAINLLGFFKLLYVFEDKHGYNNVFTSMEDFVSYITNDGSYERHCFSNALLEPDHPDYQEGVDAVDRYLIALNNGVEWDKYIPE